MELLSPAGSRQALEAAVRCGADAVYLGLDRFNARQGAANFDPAAFREAVAFCHPRGVAVHVTLNTLAGDSELPDLLDAVEQVCEAGADAAIVQDVGLARLIREAAPELALHASTQLSIHSAAGLPLLKEMGFCRVVLAREMSREEIARTTRAAAELGMETEVFVHGALCMCLSGQCYMSSIIGQRSGNRGLCAQPCRLAFADGGYPLSLKDLSLLEHLEELESMGVASLKIEGRSKRPEYVGAATAAFRQRLDGGKADPALERQLESVFRRSGHTDGYFTGRLGAAMFGHRTREDEAASADTLSAVHALYRAERQSLPVTASLTLTADRPASLTLSDGAHTVTVEGETAEPAVTCPLTEEKAEALCRKLGGTPFVLTKFEARLAPGLTLPAAAVNAMRRRAAEALLAERRPQPKAFSRPCLPSAEERGSGRPRRYVRFERTEQIPDRLPGVDRVYLPLGETIPELPVEMGVELPRAMFGREDAVRRQLAELPGRVRVALCHNWAAVALAREAGLSVHLGFGMNVFNRAALETVSPYGEEVTLSFELTVSAARKMGRGGILVYGRLPLMITRNCPRGGRRDCAACDRRLVDRKEAAFPLICRDGVSEVLNALPLWIEDAVDGFDFAEVRFTDESRHDCRTVLEALDAGRKSEGRFTRGLSRRGVF